MNSKTKSPSSFIIRHLVWVANLSTAATSPCFVPTSIYSIYFWTTLWPMTHDSQRIRGCCWALIMRFFYPDHHCPLVQPSLSLSVPAQKYIIIIALNRVLLFSTFIQPFYRWRCYWGCRIAEALVPWSYSHWNNLFTMRPHCSREWTWTHYH